MASAVDFNLLSQNARIMAQIADVFGARITSGKRSPEENARVGGSPNSKHLTGDAIDLGRDAPPAVVSILGTIAARGGLHVKGTAPHYHFEADENTPLRLAALTAISILAIRGLQDL